MDSSLTNRISSEWERAAPELAREWSTNAGALPTPAADGTGASAALVRAVAAELSGAEAPAVPEAARAYARARRERGVGVQEALLDLRVLGALLFRRLAASATDSTGGDVADAAARLHAALAAAAAAAAATYAQATARDAHDAWEHNETAGRTLAHDIKNPLGAAEGAAVLLLEESVAEDPAQRTHFLNMVVRNLTRARELVGRIRGVAAGRTVRRPSARSEPLAQVLGAVVDATLPLAQSRGVAVDVRGGAPDTPVDAPLVEFAVAAMLRCGIAALDGAADARLVISAPAPSESEGARVDVEAGGLGEAAPVPPDRFSAAEPGAPGLALALARDAVEEAGGTLAAVVAPGELLLRLALPAAAPAGAAPEPPEATPDSE